jgi:hypothetical protein
LYIATAFTLAEAEQRQGNAQSAQKLIDQASSIARATGLEGIFGPATPQPQPAVPLEGEKESVPIGDTGNRE